MYNQTDGKSMARVYVKIARLTRMFTAQKQIILDAQNILDLLGKMDKKLQGFRDLAFDKRTGKVHPEIMVLVNKRLTYNYALELHDGDTVEILPIVTGG